MPKNLDESLLSSVFSVPSQLVESRCRILLDEDIISHLVNNSTLIRGISLSLATSQSSRIIQSTSRTRNCSVLGLSILTGIGVVVLAKKIENGLEIKICQKF